MAHYAFLNNDHTTETLREELMALSNEMSNLTSAEEQDTAAIETKQAEIDAKYQEIDNCLCVVTGVITGVLETQEKSARDETIEQEIRDLEDSRTGKTQEEVTAIEAEIQVKLEELHALPPDIIDNTVYWEGYYGKADYAEELRITQQVVSIKMVAHRLEKIMQGQVILTTL